MLHSPQPEGNMKGVDELSRRAKREVHYALKRLTYSRLGRLLDLRIITLGLRPLVCTSISCATHYCSGLPGYRPTGCLLRAGVLGIRRGSVPMLHGHLVFDVRGQTWVSIWCLSEYSSEKGHVGRDSGDIDGIPRNMVWIKVTACIHCLMLHEAENDLTTISWKVKTTHRNRCRQI